MTSFNFNALNVLSTDLAINVDRYGDSYRLDPPNPEVFLAGLRFTFNINRERIGGGMDLCLDKNSTTVLASGWQLQLDYIVTSFIGHNKESTEKESFVLRDGEAFSQNVYLYHRLEFEFLVTPRDFHPYVFDFTSPQTRYPFDCTIHVKGEEERPIFVQKTILAMSSPFFKTLFYGQFVEAGKDEVEIGDTTVNDLLDYIFCVYPNPRPFDVLRIEKILRLADRFQNQELQRSCEGFLLKITNTEDKCKALEVCDTLGLDQTFREVVNRLSNEELKKLSIKGARKFKQSNLVVLLARFISL